MRKHIMVLLLGGLRAFSIGHDLSLKTWSLDHYYQEESELMSCLDDDFDNCYTKRDQQELPLVLVDNTTFELASVLHPIVF
jgi:hypothetical protein